VKDLSEQTRILIASALALVVITVWTLFLKPPSQPPRPAQTGTEQPSPAAENLPLIPSQMAPSGKAAKPPVRPAAVSAHAAAGEKTVVVENGLYRIEISNHGGVVRSWQLKKYTDDAKPSRTLDLVHADVAQLFGWPFSLVLDDPQLETAANNGLYEVTPASSVVAAPAEVKLEWSDGHLSVSKRLKFDHDKYLIELETNVTLDGKPLTHSVAWRGGFGDITAYKPAQSVNVFFSAAGKFQNLAFNKLGSTGAPATPLRRGTFEYAGIEDHYFAAVFLSEVPGTSAVTLTDWSLQRDVVVDGKPGQEPVVEMAASAPSPGPLHLRVFVGPKDYDHLKSLRPPLTDLVQFGWLEFIALPLFFLLRWVHGYVPNYGWAIVLMTILLNMVLYPLKMKSWRSMQKMQRVAPEMKAIQERYKKYSMRDPRKQEMNKEIMDLYAREGVSPMGGCLPNLLQMPVWIGFYSMLRATIELRHAAWLGWIRDLSAPDPYYILPILMGVTMYATQKMMPVTTADPSQQRMMTLMPLMLVGFFLITPTPSGLVLYILASNLVGMAQQWHLNRTAPPNLQPGRGKGGKKK
jgi:YidC/Oxa1 family membrane protein insertase